MTHDAYPGISLHNVAATEPAGWATGGQQLLRVPQALLPSLNVAARERMRHPAGCELRFVPTDETATVSVTLSAPSEISVRPFWGCFQGAESFNLSPTPRTIDLAPPERLANLRPEYADVAFDPRVCRLRFDPAVPVAIHDVSGSCRPPADPEVPKTRYLAYGTSITEGFDATAPHLSYVAQAARRSGVDPLNLGASGSAFCERAIAEHVAARDDWDVATLSLSVNMANRGFTVEQFRTRAAAMVDTIAAAHPDRPVLCITLYPYHADIVRGDDPKRAAAFRDTLRTIVEESPHRNVSLLDGQLSMDATGLTTDCLHPGDAGMADIGRRVAAELDAISG